MIAFVLCMIFVYLAISITCELRHGSAVNDSGCTDSPHAAMGCARAPWGDVGLGARAAGEEDWLASEGSELNSVGLGSYRWIGSGFDSWHDTGWINPSTGLPMLSGPGGVDVGGNRWCEPMGSDDWHHSR